MLIYTLFTKRIKSVGDLCLQLESQFSESPWIPPFPELRNILGIIITGCRAAGKTAPSHATQRRSSQPEHTIRAIGRPSRQRSRSRTTPAQNHIKIALCGQPVCLTMKCEPSHHVVWYNMHRKTAIFQRPKTTPPMPAYHTSPKTIEKRIVWQTERVIRAGRPSALVTIMFYGSTPAICRTSASALNNPSPICVAMCAPER